MASSSIFPGDANFSEFYAEVSTIMLLISKKPYPT